jgi:hypothetical protein
MANYYVYHAAAGAGTGADWTNAFTTLAAAVTGKAAGDTFYVADDHAETTAAGVGITSPGTDANGCRIFCVRRVGGSVPPVAADLRATATVSNTGAFNMTVGGSFSEINGITFNCGSAANTVTLTLSATSQRTCRFVNCKFILNSTSGSSRLQFGTTSWGNCVILENCTLQFGTTGQLCPVFGNVIWRNSVAFVPATSIPANLFNVNSGGASFLFEGVDFSAHVAGKVMFSSTNSTCKAVFKDCKMGGGTIFTGTAGPGQLDVVLIRCDTGSANYKEERYSYLGTQTTEAAIVRSGGASDGTTPFSHKIVTTANSRFDQPFECLPISIWNDTVGSAKTVTIEGNAATLPNNDEIWIDVQYLGSSSSPLASKATSAKATALDTASALSFSAASWAGGTTAFSMSTTFTPQMKGPFTIYVKAAKASSTLYIDPKPVIT